ncbi:MAG: hypothetical protein OHK93_001975 [Ramalina farinacea]|uniref:HMG box domain-containing protein n=1 Tax=Ramalina farinacea TaxID=258253 RepID=A0AA43TTC3_9LECA|nr:hypothetical protein [Ramalina farinacea]
MGALYNVLSSLSNTRNALNTLIATSTQHRTYTDRPVSRPKGHTGRLPASKKAPTTSATKAAKKPATKKTTPKKTPNATADATTKKKAAKPRIKAKPKKAKAKKKARAKAKPKKKPLTKEEKAEAKTKKAAQAKKTQLSDLKKKALLLPSRTEETAWNVFHTEQAKGKKVGQEGFSGLNKNISAAWKAIEPEQLEHYNHLANKNREANDLAYRQFVESYTPLQISEANKARLLLKRLLKQNGQKTFHLSRFQKIKDERLVKRPVNIFNAFCKDRHRSHDFKGIKVTVAAGLIGREWKALSAEDKKKYEDEAQQDRYRYTQELKTVYNKDPSPKKKAAA